MTWGLCLGIFSFISLIGYSGIIALPIDLWVWWGIDGMVLVFDRRSRYGVGWREVCRWGPLEAALGIAVGSAGSGHRKRTLGS